MIAQQPSLCRWHQIELIADQFADITRFARDRDALLQRVPVTVEQARFVYRQLTETIDGAP